MSVYEQALFLQLFADVLGLFKGFLAFFIGLFNAFVTFILRKFSISAALLLCAYPFPLLENTLVILLVGGLYVGYIYLLQQNNAKARTQSAPVKKAA